VGLFFVVIESTSLTKRNGEDFESPIPTIIASMIDLLEDNEIQNHQRRSVGKTRGGGG